MEPYLALSLGQSSSLARGAEILSSAISLATLLLVERRGRHLPIDPKRQIEIRTLLNSLPDAVMIIDPSGRIVDGNSAAERLSDLPRQQLVGSPIGDVLRRMLGETSANVVTLQKPMVHRALAGKAVREEHRHGRNPNTGEELELLISANSIRDDRGETKGALVVVRNITELSRLQQRLADIERHQAIGHVAAGIVHDFNNTLQTISQVVAVLEMSPDHSPEQRKVFLEMIQNAVRRGAEVIARIRDYLRSGKAEQENIDVRSILEEALELTRPMWQARSVKVKRSINSCGLVRGNKADVLRVFTNLIINSLQAMGNGGALSAGCEDEGGMVHVWVHDTGHGITAENRKKIFHPYFTTKAGGTGLGLSGAQKIMLEMGGDISFTSDPGRETQFDLKFPKIASVQQKLEDQKTA